MSHHCRQGRRDIRPMHGAEAEHGQRGNIALDYVVVEKKAGSRQSRSALRADSVDVAASTTTAARRRSKQVGRRHGVVDIASPPSISSAVGAIFAVYVTSRRHRCSASPPPQPASHGRRASSGSSRAAFAAISGDSPIAFHFLSRLKEDASTMAAAGQH